jgi:DDE family transposase
MAAAATCPAGHAVALGRPHADGTRLAQFKALCRGCPLRERCTTSKTGRVLSVHPQHALLAAARRAAAGPAWQDEYRRWRPPAERAIAWLVARATAASPTAASPRTTPGSTTGPPPSTSAGWSTSGSPVPATAPGHSHSATHHCSTVSDQTPLTRANPQWPPASCATRTLGQRI